MRYTIGKAMINSGPAVELVCYISLVYQFPKSTATVLHAIMQQCNNLSPFSATAYSESFRALAFSNVAYRQFDVCVIMRVQLTLYTIQNYRYDLVAEKQLKAK